jgi:signal transduction histidine kinase
MGELLATNKLETILESQITASEQQITPEPGSQQPAVSASVRQVLQFSADNLQENLDCAAVFFLLEQRSHYLALAACTLNTPSTHVPAILKLEPHRETAAAIKLQQSGRQRNLAVAAWRLSERGVAEAGYLVSNSLYEALRPLLSQDEANQLQTHLGIQQIAALPLATSKNQPVGVMLVAYARLLKQVDLAYLTAVSRQVALSLYQKSHLEAMTMLERIALTMQSQMADETEVLQTIVDVVVHNLGYAGAMVATLENGNALPVRAYCIDANQLLVQTLEKRAGQSIIGDRSVVYLDDERYRDNLSVRAVRNYRTKARRFLLSDHLFDLLRPFVNKHLCDLIQRLLAIKQVLALPFFREQQVVGNLFVMSRRAEFSADELMILTTFGQQAAVGLHNARLYRHTEEQRQIAEMFGRMAFSANASIHKLRNQIGAARSYLYLIESMLDIPAEKLRELLADVSLISGRLDQAVDLLDSLHQPWQQIPDEPVNVNYCLLRALGEVFPLTTFKPIDAQVKTESDIMVSLHLSSEMPMVETTADMLAEAFRVIIKNGVEAINDYPINRRKINISSQWAPEQGVVITIRDEGKGIHPTNLSKIFELGWSTKEGQGMGFGLFWTKDYIQGLGGTIAVESVVNKGTTFTLTLPANISWEQQTAELGQSE